MTEPTEDAVLFDRTMVPLRYRDRYDRFLAHVRAEAWEEGAQQGFDDCENGVEEWTNPYRKADGIEAEG